MKYGKAQACEAGLAVKHDKRELSKFISLEPREVRWGQEGEMSLDNLH